MTAPSRTGTGRGEQRPWTEHVDTILGWRRFVLRGVSVSWAILLVGGLLWPATWVGEATVALPNIAFAEARRPEASEGGVRETQPPVKRGIPVGTYKKIEAALSDEALLAEAFKAVPDRPPNLDRIGRNLRQIVSPMTTGARDDLVRADKDDNVGAVRISYAGGSRAQVLGVINTLASLVRESLATRIARDRVEAELLQSTATAGLALTDKLDIASRNDSLRGLVKDLEKLAATSPGTPAREVVSVTGGGYRYLPAPLQLVGARAWQADNEHLIRQAEWTFKVASLKVAFYRRLERRLRSGEARLDLVVVNDPPTIIDVELKAFAEQQRGSAVEYLRAEVEGLRDVVEAHRAATVFVQRPSLHTMSRAPWLLLGAMVSAGAVVLATLVGESWLRLHRAVSSAEGEGKAIAG